MAEPSQTLEMEPKTKVQWLLCRDEIGQLLKCDWWARFSSEPVFYDGKSTLCYNVCRRHISSGDRVTLQLSVCQCSNDPHAMEAFETINWNCVIIFCKEELAMWMLPKICDFWNLHRCSIFLKFPKLGIIGAKSNNTRAWRVSIKKLDRSMECNWIAKPIYRGAQTWTRETCLYYSLAYGCNFLVCIAGKNDLEKSELYLFLYKFNDII